MLKCRRTSSCAKSGKSPHLRNMGKGAKKRKKEGGSNGSPIIPSSLLPSPCAGAIRKEKAWMKNREGGRGKKGKKESGRGRFSIIINFLRIRLRMRRELTRADRKRKKKRGMSPFDSPPYHPQETWDRPRVGKKVREGKKKMSQGYRVGLCRRPLYAAAKIE